MSTQLFLQALEHGQRAHDTQYSQEIILDDLLGQARDALQMHGVKAEVARFGLSRRLVLYNDQLSCVLLVVEPSRSGWPVALTWTLTDEITGRSMPAAPTTTKTIVSSIECQHVLSDILASGQVAKIVARLILGSGQNLK